MFAGPYQGIVNCTQGTTWRIETSSWLNLQAGPPFSELQACVGTDPDPEPPLISISLIYATALRLNNLLVPKTLIPSIPTSGQ